MKDKNPSWNTWPSSTNIDGWRLRKIPLQIQKELLMKYEGAKRMQSYRQLKSYYEFFKISGKLPVLQMDSKSIQI
jgi:hypothetical protein